MSSEAADIKERVRGFWSRTPCGSLDATATEGTPEYYRQIELRRYEREPFIHQYADFASTCGLSVLEIGVGLGTDHVQFARAGAKLCGIDLTDRAVELVRRRLEQEGLSSQLQVADAERLPFEDASFDVVYSWGVLHHTPDTTRAFAEAIRVLRPQGRLCAMVYARHAWVPYGLWVRNGLLRGRPKRSLRDVLHDHMESVGTQGFTKREVRRMAAGVQELRIEKVATPYDIRYAGPFARLSGRQLGFFMVVRGIKAQRGS